MSRSYISVDLRQQVYDLAQGYCEYCLISEKVVFFVHQVDHIIAEKHGGLTDITNLALACIICNKYKGSDIASIDVESDDVVRLYHPRRDNWHEHFLLSAAKIMPLTAMGRVTVNLWQFNRVERIAERELLIKARLFKM